MKLSGPLSSHRNLCQIGVPELRHFIYKCRSTAQLFSSDPPEYIIKNKRPTSPTKSSINTTALADNMTNKITTQTSTVEWKLPEVNYLDNYRKLNGQLHCSSRPSKLIYKVNSDFTLLAWVSL